MVMTPIHSSSNSVEASFLINNPQKEKLLEARMTGALSRVRAISDTLSPDVSSIATADTEMNGDIPSSQPSSAQCTPLRSSSAYNKDRVSPSNLSASSSSRRKSVPRKKRVAPPRNDSRTKRCKKSHISRNSISSEVSLGSNSTENIFFQSPVHSRRDNKASKSKLPIVSGKDRASKKGDSRDRVKSIRSLGNGSLGFRPDSPMPVSLLTPPSSGSSRNSTNSNSRSGRHASATKTKSIASYFGGGNVSRGGAGSTKKSIQTTSVLDKTAPVSTPMPPRKTSRSSTPTGRAKRQLLRTEASLAISSNDSGNILFDSVSKASSDTSSTNRSITTTSSSGSAISQTDERINLQLKESQDTCVFLQTRLQEMENKVEDEKKSFLARQTAASKVFENILRKKAQLDKRDSRQQLKSNSLRLGHIVVQRTSPHNVHEVWRDGYQLKDLYLEQAALISKREALERERREVAKDARKAKTEAKKKKDEFNASNTNAMTDHISVLKQTEREELVRVGLLLQKKKEEEVGEKRKHLESEKKLHIRELKRCRDEDSSRFVKHPVLHNRYLLTKLLGKGGFSEVWLAFDLIQYREVACKVHQLNPSWSEERKHSYTKHATREYAIHKSLRHDRVVRLFDVFEIDVHSFATVLEYCSGPDLDLVLKERKFFPEKEARVIIIQVLSALHYLNCGNHGNGPIIHYDLKPGNIIFDTAPNIKITDFGLSKIVDDSNRSDAGGGSIELTSQGAGTYWYLPPECFRVSESNKPRISSKVDVWSVGVIFFQLLFGVRPFGEGMTQERLVSERTMLNAREVKFPEKAPSKVSEEAKDFIRSCLAHSAGLRPDVSKICMHPYLQKKKT